jgi:hypothetical protein
MPAQVGNDEQSLFVRPDSRKGNHCRLEVHPEVSGNVKYERWRFETTGITEEFTDFIGGEQCGGRELVAKAFFIERIQSYTSLLSYAAEQ